MRLQEEETVMLKTEEKLLLRFHYVLEVRRTCGF